MKRDAIIIDSILVGVLILALIFTFSFNDFGEKVSGKAIMTEGEKVLISPNYNWISCIDAGDKIVTKYKTGGWIKITKIKTFINKCKNGVFTDYSCDGNKPYSIEKVCENGCIEGKCLFALSEGDKKIADAIVSCDIDYLKKIADTDALRVYCLNPSCNHDKCNYNNISASKLALLNIKPERLVGVRIAADDAFILYLNGVEKMRGNKWDKLYEKDILMSDGDIILIWVWDKGGSKWLVFEAFDKETGELIFNSKAANPLKGNPAEWVTYPDYADWTISDYTIQLNLFYDETNFKYKGAYIPWKTTYDTKTGSFDESYNNLYKSTEFSKVKNQLKDSSTEFVWGGYYKTRESLVNNPTSMSKFWIGRKIKFPEDLK